MMKWLAVSAVILYLASFLYSRRLSANEGRDERGKMILYKSRSSAFPFLLGGWALLYFANQYLHLSYLQFQNSVVFLVVAVNLIQFFYLLFYRRQY
ncbi:hypothetical protein [Alicyclobacillus sp. SO9]|uniref:hypothetical protein n=1 Tax=Alicyclobacillus sp. SO9 TaxID=2665646 RepID=UPI0018E8665A|nr:hypothetical protein [Alicyclobacillus sp. SO9]QQE79164.1 hypothetical protein GI364_01195 [Alicyclobacillus sp. SO9]